MSLPTLVVGALGVSHLGNDRTGNPIFRGQTVGLQGIQIRIKLVRASISRCFTARCSLRVGRAAVLELSRSSGLVCAVGASV